MELFTIYRRSKSRTCQKWQVFTSDSLKSEKSNGSFSTFPPSFQNQTFGHHGKHSKKIQNHSFKSVRVLVQSLKRPIQKPRVWTHKQQRWFQPARFTLQRQRIGSTVTMRPVTSKAIAIQLLVILYPYSGFVEHQTEKKKKKSRPVKMPGQEELKRLISS